MAQTKDGAKKIAAAKAGVTVAEYNRQVALGKKWCTACKAFHSRLNFAPDSSRSDGLTAACHIGRQRWRKEKYVRSTRTKIGRNFVPARDGDKKQARRRIGHFVQFGIIPRPSVLPCRDCGDTTKIHQYDHYLGYAAEHHEHVESVCIACHNTREKARKDAKNVGRNKN